MSRHADHDHLEKRLGYRFRDRKLLIDALTHKSFVNEHPDDDVVDNERLEFLGDAVLDLGIGHMLMDAHPELAEGELSITRAQIVSEAGLDILAERLELGRYLRLGKGEEGTGGREKPSLRADAFEAVIAAVYLDGGFDAAVKVIRNLFADRIDNIEVRHASFYDFKTRMQERAQALWKVTPTYKVIGEYGPDHDKTFAVALLLRGREFARAAGKSKKEAEQQAAAAALFILDGADLDALEFPSDDESEEEETA